MSRPRWRTIATMAALSMAVLAGCGEQQQLRDLENIPVTDPDKVRMVVNVDTYPNIVALCIEGAGFAATTRDSSPAALQHIPTWDAPDGWCAR